MKKIVLLFLFFVRLHGYSQKMQATIRPGSAVHTIDIYLKPSASFLQKDEAMTITVAIPATVRPAPSIGSSGVTANGTGPVKGITGLQPNILVNNVGTTQREVVVSLENIDGAAHYVYTFIFAGTAAALHAWTAGVEQQALSISFDGCTSGCAAAIKLVSLPNGGSTRQGYCYFQANTIGDITNYSAPFYANTKALPPRNGNSRNGSSLSIMELNTGLAVTLFSFNALAREGNVDLSWQPATQEVNPGYYMVQRSEDGISFHEVGRLSATATEKAVAATYALTDRSAPAGTLFYRIGIVDPNGSQANSNIREVEVSRPGKNKVMVYPTITTGTVNIDMPPGYQQAKVRIINALGETLAMDESNSLKRTISLGHYSDGSYIVQVINNNKMTDNIKIALRH